MKYFGFFSWLFGWVMLGLTLLSPSVLRAQTGGAILSEVGIKVVRGETIEPSPLSRVAPAELVAFRQGSIVDPLEVPIVVDGSATPGVDYGPLDRSIRFSAGEAEVRIMIVALDDALAEGDETVVVQLSTPPVDGLARYAIVPEASKANVVIHDNDHELGAVIKITNPPYGAELPAGRDVEISAVAIDPAGYMPILEFYVDGELLDTSVITFIRAPDPGTPIHHSVLWKTPSAGKHELVARGKDSRGVIISSEPVVVIIAGETVEPTLVSIAATDRQGTEYPPEVDAIDPIEFEISRTGPTAGSLVVFLSLHGTASKDDYFEVPTSVIIPSDSASVKLQIVPKADFLEVLEPMETVGVRLEPSPLAGPLRTYGVDVTKRQAAGVIFERSPPEQPAVELAFPARGEGFESGQIIDVLAVSYMAGSQVEFYDGDERIGSSAVADLANTPSLDFHPFAWRGAAVGEHVLTARATLADGKQVSSERLPVVVKGSVSPAYIKLLEPGDGQVFRPGESITIKAVAIDPEGYIARVEFFADEARIGVSEIVFVRAPDPGTPIDHLFVWENAPVGGHALTARAVDSQGRPVSSWPVKILVGDSGGGDRVVLTVEAVDAVAAEEPEDSATFLIRRVAGPKDVDVPVWFSMFGTALNGVDYGEIKETTFIPAGSDSVEIVIKPVTDKAIEGDEVIGLALKDPVCVKIFPPPAECYLVGSPEAARAILRDNGVVSPQARIEMISPRSSEVFEPGADIPVSAVAIDPKGYIPRVEFYANEELIGVSEIVFIRAPDPGSPITHTYLWPHVPAGEYVLTARGVDAQGQVILSDRVKITVGTGGGGGGSEQVVVTIEAADASAAETTDSGEPDNGLFLVRRIAGSKDVEVAVNLKIGGSAVGGIDYAELKPMTILRGGEMVAEVVVQPIPDKALEGDETVEISLVEPICPAIFPPPPQCYLIKGASARVVIREQSSGADEVPTLAIVPPKDSARLEQGQPLELKADAVMKGKSCILESSTDLKTWSPVAPVVLPDGELTYVTEAGTDKQRYYRLRVQ